MNVMNTLPVGFEWRIRQTRGGVLVAEETVKNLVPTEGLNHILSVILKGGTQVTSWYIALFEGNYTPVLGLTAATFASAATECTAYDAANRVAWVGGSVSGGAVSNAASLGEFVMSANKTVYGCALMSASTKGATTGTLLSAVRFSTAKVLEDNDTLDVGVGITLVNP